MREFDADGLLVCRYQASIFERSLIKTECGSAVFIRRFMNSDVAATLIRLRLPMRRRHPMRHSI